MSVAAASTAPTNSSTVNGFKPSVIIVLLLGLGRTRCFQGVGLSADERTGARATPVPGAPIDVRFVPAGQEAVHDDTAVVRTQPRQRVEQSRDRISTEDQRVLRIEWALGRGTIEIRLDDESIRIEQMQTGQDREALHERAEYEALPLPAQHGPREPGEDAEQQDHERR